MSNLILNNELDENTKLLISKMEKEIESKNNEIEALKNELAYLKGQILNKNRKIFGKSSEQVDSNQISLFDEAEKYNDSRIVEPTIEEITYKRSKPASNIGKKDNLANLERIVIEHKLNESETICDKCNGKLTEIGKKTTKEVLKYIPAKLYIEEHVTYSYTCKNCEANADKPNIVSTKAPNTFLHKSMVSNELLAHVINLKYQHAMPLYRQEIYFKMLGANLSRQTLSNWIIGAANELEVIYDLMKQELVNSTYIQADETTLQVIENNGKESKSKKYMWLYRTGSFINPIIIYEYQKTRSGTCPKNFLKDFSGYLQTDGYAGYNSVDNIKRIYCLAHIRRKYHDIIVNLDEEALKTSRAAIGFNYCEKLYKIEKEIRKEYKYKEDYYKKRFDIRLEKTAPILEAFEKYVETEIKNALPQSSLGKALEYTQKLLPKMKTILEDGSLEIDNNGAERAIKTFVIGRKNWLFSTSNKGAKSSATLYSIMETAKANGLIVEKYFSYLMENICNQEIVNSDKLKELLPWSDKISLDLKVQVPENKNKNLSPVN